MFYILLIKKLSNYNHSKCIWYSILSFNVEISKVPFFQVQSLVTLTALQLWLLLRVCGVDVAVSTPTFHLMATH